MADQYIQVPPNSTGLKVDTSELITTVGTVERQRVQIGGNNAGDLAPVDSVNGIYSFLNDIALSLRNLVSTITRPLWQDIASGRVRVVLDPLGGAQTLGTVTTVGTVTTCSTVTTCGTVTGMTNIYVNPANTAAPIKDVLCSPNELQAWALCVRARIT